MAGERHGNGMGAAWARYAMCESAFTGHITLIYAKNIIDLEISPHPVHCVLSPAIPSTADVQMYINYH